MKQLFAVVDPNGELRAYGSNLHKAVEHASTYSERVVVEGADGSGGVLAGFGDFAAKEPSLMPQLALSNAGLRPIDIDTVMRMSLEEAHAKLLPYFPQSRTRKSGEVVAVGTYKTAKSMAENLLGQNYKTSKETPEDPSSVMGLSLLPYDMGKKMSSKSLPMRGLGLCVGSSAACRQACLVYSGHNMIDIYNMVVKTARTESLLLEPEAFARMLVEGVGRHVKPRRGGNGYEPFVRLNVFSDVPWELVFPGLFEMYGEANFYDYTKVPGRMPPSNYDLTFSYSGVNQTYVEYELGRGRRIAVVFLVPGTLQTRREQSLPPTFMGHGVVDGDVSDVRPRDPAPGVVGLRWKLPLGQTADKRQDNQNAFVVPCVEVDGVLVASQSARQEPIVDPDSETT